jgi:hypothetical protein
MPENKYAVYDGHMNLLASDMTLYDATLFCKALFDDAYAEPGLTFVISRISPEGGENDVEHKGM